MAPDTVGATVSVSTNQKKPMNLPSTPTDRLVQRSTTGEEQTDTQISANIALLLYTLHIANTVMIQS